MMHLEQSVVLFVVAAIAGAINAVAGGGTLLTFPALLWAGQTSIWANATSTVALWPGALSSFWGYRGELASSRREMITLAVPSFVGGVIGSLLLVRTSTATFDALVPWLILLATLLFTLQGPLARWQRHRAQATHEEGHGGQETLPQEQPRSQLRWAAVLAFQFLVGLYGGYFGAGIGILMLAAYGFLGFTNIHHMNALKNLNAMCINGIAAGLFILKGLVDWRFALLMAAGSIAGGYLGAGTARRIGQRTVRLIVILIGLGLTLSLLVRRF